MALNLSTLIKFDTRGSMSTPENSGTIQFNPGLFILTKS